jgi:hypothetical protein
LLLQAPVESQVPEQRDVGSSLLRAAVHLWVASHCWQVPAQSVSTQQSDWAMQVPLQDLVEPVQA